MKYWPMDNMKCLTLSNVKYSSKDECVSFFYGCGRGDPLTRLRLAQDDILRVESVYIEQ